MQRRWVEEDGMEVGMRRLERLFKRLDALCQSGLLA